MSKHPILVFQDGERYLIAVASDYETARRAAVLVKAGEANNLGASLLNSVNMAWVSRELGRFAARPVAAEAQPGSAEGQEAE